MKGILAGTARQALQLAAMRSAPLDKYGYTATAEQNLIEGVDLDDFRGDFEMGSGNELAGKFRAAHSSSALAANCFGPFVRNPGGLVIIKRTGFQNVDFESKCPVGLKRPSTPPNLDVLLDSDDVVVAIESKCTEYLSRKSAKFSDAYNNDILDERRNGPWFTEMERLRKEPNAYAYLDAAQLIKHAFGIGNTYRGRKAILLYIFWEPANASQFAAFDLHRSEIKDFSERVAGGFPEFTWTSYSSLWASWKSDPQQSWVQEHATRLQQRYDVRL